LHTTVCTWNSEQAEIFQLGFCSLFFQQQVKSFLSEQFALGTPNVYKKTEQLDRWFVPFDTAIKIRTIRHCNTNQTGELLFFAEMVLKSLLAKAAALRINLNLDGAPLASKSHTHPFLLFSKRNPLGDLDLRGSGSGEVSPKMFVVH